MAAPTTETETNARRDAAIRRLAADLKAAFDRFDAVGDVVRCLPGCTCPLERVLVAMNLFVGASVAYDRGELLPPHLGLPDVMTVAELSDMIETALFDDDELDSDADLDDDG